MIRFVAIIKIIYYVKMIGTKYHSLFFRVLDFFDLYFIVNQPVDI
jgi:hypothetical protein